MEKKKKEQKRCKQEQKKLQTPKIIKQKVTAKGR